VLAGLLGQRVGVLVGVAPDVPDGDLLLLAIFLPGGQLLAPVAGERGHVEPDLLGLDDGLSPSPEDSIAFFISLTAPASKGLMRSCVGSGTLMEARALRSVGEP